MYTRKVNIPYYNVYTSFLGHPVREASSSSLHKLASLYTVGIWQHCITSMTTLPQLNSTKITGQNKVTHVG
jgi:hypothetical protein